VLWAIAAAGSVGLLLGLRFRMPAVLAASALILAGGSAAVPFAGAPLWTVLGTTFGTVCALQGGYLVGLLLWCALSRSSRLLLRLPARDAFNGDGPATGARAPRF
jgi:hypothetical protein